MLAWIVLAPASSSSVDDPPPETPPPRPGGGRDALRGEFESDRIVLKLRAEVGLGVPQAMTSGFGSLQAGPDTAGLDTLVAEYGVREMRRAFPAFDGPGGQLQATAADLAATSLARHPERAARAPHGATVPDLENVFVAEIGEGVDVLEAVAAFSQHPDGTFSLVTESDFPEGTAPSGGVAAIGDYDGDGDLDIYAPGGAFGRGGSGGLFQNLIGTQNHWIRIDLEGSEGNREGYGARVSVETGETKQLREVHTSAVETLPLHFGLGQASRIDELAVRWPSGLVQRLHGVGVDQRLTLFEADAAQPVGLDVKPGSDPSTSPAGASSRSPSWDPRTSMCTTWT